MHRKTDKGRVLVAQLGARMHYAVPKVLEDAGALERLFSDYCPTAALCKVLGAIPTVLRTHAVHRALGRIPFGVPREKIHAFNSFGLEYLWRRQFAQGPQEAVETHLWAGRAFCERVLQCGFGGAATVYAYNSAALELIQAARDRGLRTCIEQTIAPLAHEQKLMKAECNRFPGWASLNGSSESFARLAQREAAEWDATDIIVCGSQFVLEGIKECGGPHEKCVVVPYGVDFQLPPSVGLKGKSYDGTRPLRVLTIGTVGLRKGSQYVLEAAKRLKGVAEFRIVGTIGVTRDAELELRQHLQLTGPVPRSCIVDHLQWADVFLLPSICEGSATVTYEAIATGLPVICTPNAGSVVQDGLDGFLVPVYQVEPICNRLSRLASDSNLLMEMRHAAITASENFTVRAFGNRLLSALSIKSRLQQNITAAAAQTP